MTVNPHIAEVLRVAQLAQDHTAALATAHQVRGQQIDAQRLAQGQPDPPGPGPYGGQQ